MRNFILIASSIILISCSAQKKITTTASSQAKEKKEGRKIYGTVSEKYLKESLTEEEWKAAKKPDLSFKVDNEYYYIKISNSKITEQDMNGLIGKKIEVKGKLVGEGYGGEISIGMPPMKKGGSKSKDVQEKSIGYIVIYEIIEGGK
jgi:hypothetical protein